ncbi:hypothetical protein NC652_029761 [Populus alba x Populus x berolinensis]|uniref:Uncharacterized protein n=1 Tax=Populus alba x Populus x berolinensis TaxID=444605 RepID=A0AAD6M2L8_9ROSI|nr:hypothetical protein NC652_029761 [Populus alba x Populus x berolinensis]KAJ6977580.1 hypothetical protein NC653_029470 [Populus alba x Populus x berolinensis]
MYINIVRFTLAGFNNFEAKRPSVITPPRIRAASSSDRLSAVFFPSCFSKPRKICRTS